MKRRKTLKGYIIAEAATSKKESGYKFLVFTKDEWECGPGCRYPEWECDSIEEAEEWIKSC